jgi:hypothetical protein
MYAVVEGAGTYTPIGWDRAAGTMRLLVYLHSGGPGSQ